MLEVASPTVLVIRDGWGRNPNPSHDAFNAVHLAATPCCDALLREYPWTLVRTSGRDVGLPDGTMGNSEVGHQNLGAGRIVRQDAVRISEAITSGRFARNRVLCDAMARARGSSRPVHLIGLGSDAGVHSRLSHLYGCLSLCCAWQVEAVIHLITDGRDTGPFTACSLIEQIQRRSDRLGTGEIATVCGRFYAMDRSHRWERVQAAYDLLTGRHPDAPRFTTAAEAVQDYYRHPARPTQRGDEFIRPRYVGPGPGPSIRDGDTVIFYNYRGDRPRQLVQAFVLPDFFGHVVPSPDGGARGFDRGRKLDLLFVTMNGYQQALGPYVQVAFDKPPTLDSIGGQYLAELGLTQFRCAETEKFAHGTFFFNDYRDEPFAGESRRMAQSPLVDTYDLAPAMSAAQVTQSVLERLASNDCEHFILVNLANADMVGHTGNLAAAVEAVEEVDGCVGRLANATLKRGGRCLVTADHGNAEQMVDPATGSAHTAHTTYDVECIVVDRRHGPKATGSGARPSSALRAAGRLADIFPTVLDLMGLAKPEAMTGRSLLQVD